MQGPLEVGAGAGADLVEALIKFLLGLIPPAPTFLVVLKVIT
jgi:hypothetical protein